MPRTKLQKHVQETIFKEGQRVLIVDGVLATIRASHHPTKLYEEYEGKIVYSPHRPKRYDVYVERLDQVWIDFRPYQLKKI